MYQKDLIRDARKSAGLYDENDPKLRQFLDPLDDPTQCWPELIQACRRNFAAYKAKVAQPILDSSDTLAHLTVIRAASETDELDLLEQHIWASDPARAEAELKAIALKAIPRLNAALSGKPGLTQAVRDILVLRVPGPRQPPPVGPIRLARPRMPGPRAPSGKRPSLRCLP